MTEYEDKMSELNDIAVEAIKEMVSLHQAEAAKLAEDDLSGMRSLKQQAVHRLGHIQRWAAEASHEINLPSADGGSFPI